MRTAGYYSHALEVARSANEPHWYVDILLEDLGEYDEGIKFVFGLPRRQAADIFRKYGKVLVANKPRDSTGCLMKLCVPEKGEELNRGNPPRPCHRPHASEHRRRVQMHSRLSKQVWPISPISIQTGLRR